MVVAASERPLLPEEITAAVLASFAKTPDARLGAVMEALVSHLHAFVTEVRLTRAEWETAITVLTETGAITSLQRQEFVLWSDTLGLSMLVDALDSDVPQGATESTVLGPFYVAGSPWRADGESIAEQEGGVPAIVRGQVRALDGTPIAGAVVDVWQNGPNRLYAVQDATAPHDHLRGRFRTDAEGRFSFRAVRPVPYPIPDDGPVGRMLAATGRRPWRPAHIHLIAEADGYRRVATHIFDADSDYLETDAVFAVKPSLVHHFVFHGGEDADRPAGIESDYVAVDVEIVLAPLEDLGAGA